MRSVAVPTRSFLCLRHGSTDWNRQGRFQGRTDIPLNDDGVAQAHAAARRLQHVRFDYVVASPLVRAVKTAEIVATACAKVLAIDDGLIECDFGSLEGRSIHATMNQHGLATVEDLVSILPADGEPWPSIAQRSLRCVSLWLDRHAQSTILFVCHDAVMQSMAETLCQRWFENSHGTPVLFARNGDAWTLEEV